MAVRASADYSFGTATGPDGSVYFTEFKGRLNRLTPQGELTRTELGRGGAYGVAVDGEGCVYVGMDSHKGDGAILRISPDGETSTIAEGLTRPRQLACDVAGNVYFVTEGEPSIRRWDQATGEAETILDGLRCPQGVAVAPDGTVYFSEYGRFGERGIALEAGSVHARRPDGTVSKVAGGIWRARGIALGANGEIFAAGEANVWDQGNSGVLFRIAADGKMKGAVLGLDYPQVPAVGPDGAVYFGLCRDNLLVSFDETNECSASTWPGEDGVEVGVCGGTWRSGGVSEGSAPLRLSVGELEFAGEATVQDNGEALRVWVRIPAERLNLDREPLPYPGPESHLPGMFRLPAATCPGATQVHVMPARRHVRSRWPVRYNSAGTEIAAEGFDESPEAYLVYVEYPVSHATRKGD